MDSLLHSREMRFRMIDCVARDELYGIDGLDRREYQAAFPPAWTAAEKTCPLGGASDNSCHLRAKSQSAKILVVSVIGIFRQLTAGTPYHGHVRFGGVH